MIEAVATGRSGAGSGADAALKSAVVLWFVVGGDAAMVREVMFLSGTVMGGRSDGWYGILDEGGSMARALDRAALACPEGGRRQFTA